MTPQQHTNGSVLRESLPSVVRAHLDDGKSAAFASSFAPEAVVIDDGRTYASQQEILGWLHRTSNEFTYTTTFLGAQRLTTDQYVVRNRLDGNFPGNTADRGYRFNLENALIVRLEIST